MKSYKNKFTKENLIQKDIPLLSYLTEEEFLSIKANLDIQDYAKGELVFRSNDPADKMFVILEGELKISKIMSDGREQILYIYDEGDFVGAHNILSASSYEYSAYSLKKSKVLTISSRDVHQILKKNNSFLLILLAQSFERIRKAENLIDRLSVISTDVKVAKLLKNLSSLYGQDTKDGILINHNTTQEELGSLAGISRETMSRKLNQFEEEGLIKLVSRGKILIVDQAKLDNILL